MLQGKREELFKDVTDMENADTKDHTESTDADTKDDTKITEAKAKEDTERKAFEVSATDNLTD